MADDFIERIRASEADEPDRILRYIRSMLNQPGTRPDWRDFMECKQYHVLAKRAGRTLAHSCGDCSFVCSACHRCVITKDEISQYKSSVRAEIRAETCACKNPSRSFVPS